MHTRCVQFLYPRSTLDSEARCRSIARRLGFALCSVGPDYPKAQMPGAPPPLPLSASEERIKALPNRDLEPNERTRRLALIGAENGEVEGKALQNRILTRVGTTEAPLIEGSKFGEDTSAIAVFHALANRIVAKIRAKRRQVRE